MGLFSNLFSNRTREHPLADYPLLDESCWAGKKIVAVEEELKRLAQRISGPLEVVPSDHAAYVFVGEAPKKFGLLWIRDGKVNGFFGLLREHGVTPAEVRKALSALRKAYAEHQDVERYTATIGQYSMVVTVSGALGDEVHRIIGGMQPLSC